MGKIVWLASLFVLSNLADYVTTVFGIRMGFSELNSLVASLNPLLYLLLKIFIVSTVVLLLLVTYNLRENGDFTRGIYFGLVAGVVLSTIFISLIVTHNLMLLAGFPENKIFVEMISDILI